ncbi:hypothetical protein BUALT_Bualt02G0191500 [Buddleja alternifolia]|uniref:GATA-type domain-containing protein n=1 Tax=Buddleja alternifolia TaxID=168488 RepID=A0AAV6Y5P9_9LAMI|nr:hypothetical protein BUALT_Bualt02G0191500 [Buddleja alternifolia]
MERKSQISPESKNDQVTNLDLTLRLGMPANDIEKFEENKNAGSSSLYGFPGVDGYALNNEIIIVDVVYLYYLNKGNFSMHGNVEFGGGSSTNMYYPADASNFMFYQGIMPPNPTTPTRKRQYKADDSKICKYCGVKSTPLWRKGPDGPQTLCNACGLRHSRTVKKDAE